MKSDQDSDKFTEILQYMSDNTLSFLGNIAEKISEQTQENSDHASDSETIIKHEADDEDHSSQIRPRF